MQKFVQRLSNLGPPGSGKEGRSTFGPYVEKTPARVNKHSEKFCFGFFFPQGVFNLGWYKFFVLLVFKNGNKNIIIYSPYLHEKKKKTPLTTSLCFPPASAPSADKLYFVIHVTLRLGAVNTLAFISYTVFSPHPFYHSEDLWC